MIYKDIERRYGEVYIIPKSLARSFYDENRKFHRSHHSFKRKANKSEQKQQSSSSLFVKKKKEPSFH